MFLLLAVGGCSHIITADTPYYNDGPEQLDPPQGDVAKGTWCLVIGERGTYYHILTGDGVNAYVWKAAVEPLLDFRRKEKERNAEAERQKRLERAGLKPPADQPPPATPPATQPDSPPGRL
ncbi:MAG: hypothetical protein IT450_02070 [Phycisphaerales bacterium]|nr:hypothetical protein [Phycisphaerales bacterium]